jgi:adenine-specific DNA-methyltransferase
MSSNSISAHLVVGDALSFLSGIEQESVDLLVSSPPYFMGKEYDTSLKLEDFVQIHEQLAPLLVRAIKPGETCVGKWDTIFTTELSYL